MGKALIPLVEEVVVLVLAIHVALVLAINSIGKN